MIARNQPEPSPDTVVPSSIAERYRMWRNDSLGLVAYVLGAGLFAVLALVTVIATP
jgi:hypothetical protein